MEKKILWIQKDSPFAAEGAQFFRAKGWEVEQCFSGASGMEKITTWEPDVVIVGQEVTDFNPFIVLKNVASSISTSQLLLFVADEDFLKKIERDHEKWEALTPHMIQTPLDYEKLYDYCKNWNAETSDVGRQEILYHFSKTTTTEHKKVAPKGEPPAVELSKIEKKGEVKEEKKEVKKEPAVSSVDSKLDVKALKQYLALKEKELVELQADFNRTQEQLNFSNQKVLELESECKKMSEQQETLHKKGELLSRENEELRERTAKDVKSREQEVQTKADKLLLAERRCEIAEKKYEELKERVKKDIQQIRIHEKELEARLEILKRDSETLLVAKYRKLLEFKRKIDSLEYEMESLVEKEKAAQKKIEGWKERMNRVLRALKLGTSLLESEENIEQEISKATAQSSQSTQPSITTTKKSTKDA